METRDKGTEGHMHMARTAGALVAAAAVTSAIAGCGGGSGATASPPPWSASAGNTSYLAGTTIGGSPTRSTAANPTAWNLSLPDKQNPNVPTNLWPDAQNILTQAQLKAAVPEATTVKLQSCTKGTSSSGATTSKNQSCTWTVSLPGDSAGLSSSIQVSIVAFGADGPMTSAWNAAESSLYQDRQSTDRFYQEGAFGAKGSYILANHQSAVLVSDGNLAGWIDLNFTGFYSLSGSNASTSLMQGVFPVLAKDIADQLPRKYA
ncbi:hypothetical protein BKA23_0972 [Rudaeicoccus suwonensis]|uniref:Uncharacterized protein n=2 Tax=Rudaeicoccus suwonensis TaxID=657409 RepID=A0A561E993_9MICO|nr:hypothetical protein BKA23_0972 [Rudaeicoccus suwonensis]